MPIVGMLMKGSAVGGAFSVRALIRLIGQKVCVKTLITLDIY